MKAKLKNKEGQEKEVKVGISWLTFFLGFFGPLFRTDWKWFAIMLLGGAVLGGITCGIGAIVLDIVMGFKYNKIYTKELIEQGYEPATDEDAKLLKDNGYIE